MGFPLGIAWSGFLPAIRAATSRVAPFAQLAHNQPVYNGDGSNASPGVLTSARNAGPCPTWPARFFEARK